MTFNDLLQETKEDYQKYGLEAFRFTAQNTFHGLLSRFGLWWNDGNDFYDEDWDLLILVDACRWNLMEEVLDEYDYVESLSPFTSCASHSREWLHKTFKENNQKGLAKLRLWLQIMRNPDDIRPFRDGMDMKDMSNTAYVSWNMFTEMLDEDYFLACEKVGRDEWPPEEDILDPRKLTDRTINIMREMDPDRTIVHYMQPHTPFPGDEQRHEIDGSVWERIQRGEKDFDEMWKEYKDNLRWVMDDIGLLLNNVDAEKVVVSSDHGNAVGEWGCYGHRPYVPIEAEKKVPWVTATATDTGKYEPEESTDSVNMTDEDIKQRLENLGYV